MTFSLVDFQLFILVEEVFFVEIKKTTVIRSHLARWFEFFIEQGHEGIGGHFRLRGILGKRVPVLVAWGGDAPGTEYHHRAAE